MTLPLISYTSTVAWVDDDELFLRTISQLINKKFNVKTFKSPKDSIEYFKNYSPILPKVNFVRGCSESDNYGMLNHMPIDLNINALSEFRNNEERKSEVSVLVVDYNMPEMNGIELCRAMKDLPMKKILLTGDANHQLAVDAFNEGIIDGFIRKDSPTIADDIIFHLNKLSQRYFVEQTKQLKSHLEVDCLLPQSDLAFSAFFKEWCELNSIVEYYLIDKHGNSLVIDAVGSKSYFIVHTDRTLDSFSELHQDDGDALLFVESVVCRKSIPFFGEGKEGWEMEPSKWAACFYQPQTLVGAEKYYWAIAS